MFVYCSLEELSPETAWNGGGVSIRGGRGKEGLTQKQLAELTGIASTTSARWKTASGLLARKPPESWQRH